MRYAQLRFLGMTDYIKIGDNQDYYSIDLPTLEGIARFIFAISLNEYYESSKGNAPECIAKFSHVEILK